MDFSSRSITYYSLKQKHGKSEGRNNQSSSSSPHSDQALHNCLSFSVGWPSFSLTYKFTVINLFLWCIIRRHPQFISKIFIQESFSFAAKFFIGNWMNIFSPTILTSCLMSLPQEVKWKRMETVGILIFPLFEFHKVLLVFY